MPDKWGENIGYIKCQEKNPYKCALALLLLFGLFCVPHLVYSVDKGITTMYIFGWLLKSPFTLSNGTLVEEILVR